MSFVSQSPEIPPGNEEADQCSQKGGRLPQHEADIIEAYQCSKEGGRLPQSHTDIAKRLIRSSCRLPKPHTDITKRLIRSSYTTQWESEHPAHQKVVVKIFMVSIVPFPFIEQPSYYP